MRADLFGWLRPRRVPLAVFLAVMGVGLVLALHPSAEGQPGPQREKVADLEWVDAETGEVIFRGSDLIEFDWDRQVLWLEKRAAIDFLCWAARPGLSRAFVLRDRDGVIYRGQTVSSFSSASYNGPTFMDLFPLGTTSTLFPLANGYASGAQDQRFSPRLHARLEEAGLLHPIAPETSARFGVNLVSSPYGGGVKQVGAVYFADTFRRGEEARAILRFDTVGLDKLAGPDRVLEITIGLMSEQGSFHSETALAPVPLEQVIREGYYVCRFRPWTPLPGYPEGTQPAQQRSAFVWVDVVVREKAGGAEVAAFGVAPVQINVDIPRD